MHHAEERLGIKAGSTTPDGLFTLEHAECQAACTEAPCLQVNYRYRYRVTTDQLDQLFDDLRAGALDAEIPPHGTLARDRQHIPSDRGVGPQAPEDVTRAAGVDPRPRTRGGSMIVLHASGRGTSRIPTRFAPARRFARIAPDRDGNDDHRHDVPACSRLRRR